RRGRAPEVPVLPGARGDVRVVPGQDAERPAVDEVRQRTREIFEHVADRCHAGDGLRTEGPAVRVRADHLAVDVDRTSAHPGNDLGDLEARVLRLDEDEVLTGAEVREDVDHFDVEALGLRAFEDGEAVALHPPSDFFYRQRVGTGGQVSCLGPTQAER